MKRKMLISIALILIMLLNCALPLFVVNAASGDEIVLNSKLYTAVKSSLKQQGIEFDSNDITHKLIISNISSITRLDLNNGSISDLTGLEVFTGLTHLDLSGNNLNKESNLNVLNSLTNLDYLDLSTNQLDDVSSITSLIENLKQNGEIVLSGQNVVKVESAYIDEKEDSDNSETAEFELPQILELAGFLKAKWQTVKSYDKSVNPKESYNMTPKVNKIPAQVTETDKNISVTISDKSGNIYQGLLEVYIHIYDDRTEANSASNPNKASENILNESEFYFYYVITGNSSEVITTMDTNLYEAIKKQLTGGQTVNQNLASYPYAIDLNGNIIYNEYTYETKSIFTSHNGTEFHVLQNKATKSKEFAYNPETKKLYKYSGSGDTLGEEVHRKIEKVESRTEGETGVITSQYIYKIAVENEGATGQTLYEAAYDQAKTFVIDDMVLTNKITSLILNNEQIRDLSGLEYFIGLNYELNVSHNYLSEIEPIYELDNKKDEWEAELVKLYLYWLKERPYGGNLSSAIETINTQQSKINEEVKNIEKAVEKINEILEAVGAIQKTDDDKYKQELASKAQEIKTLYNSIYGYTDENGNKVNGYVDNIKEALDGNKKENVKGINEELSNVYDYLENLYRIYENEYKLTTLLVPTLNYQTYEEYQSYISINTTEAARAVLEEEIEFLKKLEASNGLSDLDKNLLEKEFSGLKFENSETETPLADYFEEFMNTTYNRNQIQNYLDKFKEIGIYSEMANFCLIKRMNEKVPNDNYCYEEQYLEKRIKDFGYEGIPTDLEQKVLNLVKENKDDSRLFGTYKKYRDATATYSSDTAKACKGEYKKVKKLSFEITKDSTAITGKTNGNKDEFEKALKTALGKENLELPKAVEIKEAIDDSATKKGEANKLYIYNQLISLSNKLLNGDVNRYIKLPRLKVLDISYNAELDNIDRIAELSSLVDLNASYCYIANVVDIDWASMTKLRKLNLSYNYISDITALTELPNLVYLNLSKNLISGELNLNNNFKIFEHLKELDLSENQISDISSLIMYLDYVTGGNYSNYFERENSLKINLDEQELEMVIDEPFRLEENPKTVNVELPKIFTQLLAIDAGRTAFGTTSKYGRIESEGRFVTLSTETVGDKVAKVNVIPMTGSERSVDTCMGNGTTLKIKYSVTDNESNASISMNPSGTVSAKKGETVSFTATVTGENIENKNVEWTVKGNKSNNTKISNQGVLTIGEDEKATTLTVTATSVADRRATVSTKVTVLEKDAEIQPDPQNPEIKSVTITPSENVKASSKAPVKFTAVVDGDEDNKVIWSIEGKNSDSTTISTEGELTIGEDETAETITVVATSEKNQQVKATVTVTIEKETELEPNPSDTTVEDPSNLGYIKDEAYLKEIKPKTPVSAFKSIFLNGKDYDVVLTKEDDSTPITSGYVGTGMFVKLLDKNGETVVDETSEAIVYEIVVTGDVNGDGVANSIDSVLIKAHRNEVKSLVGSCLEAADINNDNKVNVSDAKLLLYHRAEVKGYGLNYVEE